MPVGKTKKFVQHVSVRESSLYLSLWDLREQNDEANRVSGRVGGKFFVLHTIMNCYRSFF